MFPFTTTGTLLPELMAPFFIGPPLKPQMSLHRILSGSEIFWYKNQDAPNKAPVNKFKYEMYSAVVE